jgi:hypothetical protein
MGVNMRVVVVAGMDVWGKSVGVVMVGWSHV